MRIVTSRKLSHYPKRDKIPAYKLSYPNGTNIKPVQVTPVFSQKQIQEIAMNSVLYTSKVGIMMVYMLSQMDENEY
jgi:hypothetical protein